MTAMLTAKPNVEPNVESSIDVLNEKMAETSFEPIQQLANELLTPPGPNNESEQKEDEWVYPYPTDFKLTEKPIDEYRELEVSRHVCTEQRVV